MIQKITASIPVSSRYALGISTIEVTGSKPDGGKRYTAIQWAIGTNYNVGKLTGFSLYYQAYSGKNKGEFIEALRFIPCMKAGFTLNFLVNNRTSIHDAIQQFTKPETALTFVQNLSLPVQFYILCSVFDRAELAYPDSTESMVIPKPVDPEVWLEVKAITQQKLPQFFGLSASPVATHKAIADQPKITIPELKGNTDTDTDTDTDTAEETKESLQKQCDLLGISYRKNYGASKLRGMIANHGK
jgi:hypothetical protein